MDLTYANASLFHLLEIGLFDQFQVKFQSTFHNPYDENNLKVYWVRRSPSIGLWTHSMTSEGMSEMLLLNLIIVRHNTLDIDWAMVYDQHANLQA